MTRKRSEKVIAETVRQANYAMRIEAAERELARLQQQLSFARHEAWQQGYNDGRKSALEEVSTEALALRKTELGAAALVIDSMAKTVHAATIALTRYFDNHTNGDAKVQPLPSEVNEGDTGVKISWD